MRILQVLPFLEKGGAERVVIELCNSLSAKGSEVTLLLISPVDINLNQINLDSRVNVVFIQSSKKGKFSWTARLIPWMIQNQRTLQSFSVIHCHLTFGLIFGSLFYVFRAFQSPITPKLVFTCHLVGMEGWQRFFNRQFSTFFDAFILVGWNNDWLEFSKKKRRKNIIVIENGISTNGSNFRNKDLISKDILNVGTISRLVFERRPWLFLQTFSEIRKMNMKKFKFILGGEGPQGKYLHKLIEELDLTDHVNMPGLVTDSFAFLGEVDLYITICVERFPGIAALEAIFHGIPVVGIQLMSDYSSDGTELIWSDQSTSVVAKKVVELVCEPSLLEAYRKQQYMLAIEKYHVSIMTEKYSREYKSSFQ